MKRNVPEPQAGSSSEVSLKKPASLSVLSASQSQAVPGLRVHQLLIELFQQVLVEGAEA